jgi:hypothetical protein
MEDKFFKDVFGDQEGVLSESAQGLVLEAFNKKVDELTTERVDLALEAQDIEHKDMLQIIVEKYENKIDNEKLQLTEQIDTDHAKIVEDTFAKLDTDRVNKIVQVKEHYEKQLDEGVSTHVNTLIEGIDSYLNTFLDKHIPADIIKDYSKDLLKKISKIVTIDESVSTDIREGMVDANKTITEQKLEIEDLKREKLLSEKLTNLPILEQTFIRESFKGKTVDHIGRNFDFARTLFSEGVSTQQTSSQNVDRPTEVVLESTKVSEEREVTINPAMAGWVSKVANTGIYD